MATDGLSELEMRAVEALRLTGRFSAGKGAPTSGDASRRISARVVEALLRGRRVLPHDRENGNPLPMGLSLSGAWIDGPLDLRDLRAPDGSAPTSVELLGCRMPDPIDISHACIARLSLARSRFVELVGEGARILGAMDLSHCRTAEVPGRRSGCVRNGRRYGRCSVRLRSAVIEGRLSAGGAVFCSHPKPADLTEARRGQARQGGYPYALQLGGTVIKGPVVLAPPPRIVGGANFAQTIIEGMVWIEGARFCAEWDSALSFQGARMERAVAMVAQSAGGRFRPFHCEGELDLYSVDARGEIYISGARILARAEPGSVARAINGYQADVAEAFRILPFQGGDGKIRASAIQGQIVLMSAKLGSCTLNVLAHGSDVEGVAALSLRSAVIAGDLTIGGDRSSEAIEPKRFREDLWTLADDGSSSSSAFWGGIEAQNIEVGGDLSLSDALFLEGAAEAPASIDFWSAEVARDTRFERLYGNKRIVLNRSTLRGSLRVADLELSGSVAFDGRGMVVDRDMTLALACSGALLASQARIGGVSFLQKLALRSDGSMAPGASFDGAKFQGGLVLGQGEQSPVAIEYRRSGQELALDRRHIRAGRRLPLAFYGTKRLFGTRCSVIELLYESEEGAGVLTLLDERGKRPQLLEGTSPPIHRFNADHPLVLDETTAVQYLEFFGALVSGPDGFFRLVATQQQLGDLRLSESDREKANAAVPPRARRDGPNWLATALVAYADLVFEAEFKVFPTGLVEMLSDKPFAEASLRLPRHRHAMRFLPRTQEPPKAAAEGASDAPRAWHSLLDLGRTWPDWPAVAGVRATSLERTQLERFARIAEEQLVPGRPSISLLGAHAAFLDDQSGRAWGTDVSLELSGFTFGGDRKDGEGCARRESRLRPGFHAGHGAGAGLRRIARACPHRLAEAAAATAAGPGRRQPCRHPHAQRSSARLSALREVRRCPQGAARPHAARRPAEGDELGRKVRQEQALAAAHPRVPDGSDRAALVQRPELGRSAPVGGRCRHRSRASSGLARRVVLDRRDLLRLRPALGASGCDFPRLHRAWRHGGACHQHGLPIRPASRTGPPAARSGGVAGARPARRHRRRRETVLAGDGESGECGGRGGDCVRRHHRTLALRHRRVHPAH